MEIVLQGGLYPNTFKTAEYYLQLDFVTRIIISTWENETINKISNDKIILIKSRKPENGTGNMNLQIVSSYNGLLEVKEERSVKMRTDQMIYHESMYKIKNYVDTHLDIDVRYANNEGPRGPIFILGMNKIYPFHPQDHIFWGYTSDLITLFNIPLMTPKNRRVGNDFKTELRCPIYLGANYFAKFEPKIFKFIDNYKEYLVDDAPKKEEAKKISEQLRDKIFKVLPRIKMFWEKYNWNYYPYDWYGSSGEYYAD